MSQFANLSMSQFVNYLIGKLANYLIGKLSNYLIIMRILIQRVSHAEVAIAGAFHSQIARGLLLLLGIEEADGVEDIDYLCRKVVQIRLFEDSQGVMNLSVQDIGGDLMVVSQFTLYAQTKKGNRPSYIRAARPEQAMALYEAFVERLQGLIGRPVVTGVFGADMQVSLLNDGPVTIFIDSKMRDF